MPPTSKCSRIGIRLCLKRWGAQDALLGRIALQYTTMHCHRPCASRGGRPANRYCMSACAADCSTACATHVSFVQDWRFAVFEALRPARGAAAHCRYVPRIGMAKCTPKYLRPACILANPIECSGHMPYWQPRGASVPTIHDLLPAWRPRLCERRRWLLHSRLQRETCRIVAA